MPDGRRRALGIARALVVTVVVAFIATQALGSWERRRDRTLPAPTGQFAVGRRLFAWRDTTRADLLAPDPSASRELLVWVWYPARAAPGAKVASYLPTAWLNAMRRTPREQRLDRVHPHAFNDAPFAGDGAYPVLLFSPALGNLPTNYTSLLEDIASHGYMVVALAHPYSTTDMVLPDGRIIRDSDIRATLPLNRLIIVLAADLVSVLDHVIQERARGDTFFAHADTARVGAFGHSIGGASAAQALATDVRFRAGMDIDGTVFGPVMESGVKQPFLLMMADLDVAQRVERKPKLTIVDPAYIRVREESFIAHSPAASWLNVTRWTHMNVADEGEFYAPEHAIAELFGLRRTGAETQRIASTYARAFFDRELRSLESPGRELVRPSGDGFTWVRKPH